MDIKDLPATLFSPAKMVYISYAVLAALKVLPAPSVAGFFVVSLLFLAVEISHNDYLRIRLNRADAGNNVATGVAANG